MKYRDKATKSCFWAAWVLSFVIIAHYSTLDFTNAFFIAVSGTAAFYLFYKQQTDFQKRYGSTRKKICIWLVAGYYCFSLFGRSIFMQQPRIEINVSKAISFILLTISLFPTIPGLLTVLSKAKKKNPNPHLPEKNWIAGVICGLILLSVDLVLTLSYYPCTMSNDSIGLWNTTTAQNIALSDYWSIAYNLLLKALWAITNAKTPYAFVVFQVAVLAIAVGDLASFLRRRDVSVKALILGTIIFSLCPSTYMLCLYLSTNPLTAILCLWVTISFAEAVTEPEHYLKSAVWQIKTIIAISALYLVRENNVMIAIPIIGFAIWYVFSNKNLGKRILITVAGAACIIGLMQGVVYKSVNYVHYEKNHETIRPLLAPIGSALQQDLDLPEDIIETAEKVLPAEEWTARYDPFISDTVTWGDPRPQYDAVSLGEAFSTYLKMLGRYPDVVIRDRLDGMNMVWDIRSYMDHRCETSILGDVSFKDIKLSTEGIFGRLIAEIRKLSSALLQISIDENLLDAFIWKNGIYVNILLVLVLFLAENKKTKLLWAIAPSVFILLTYALVVAWQMYYYIWFFPLSVVLLLIVSIVECRKNEIAA